MRQRLLMVMFGLVTATCNGQNGGAPVPPVSSGLPASVPTPGESVQPQPTASPTPSAIPSAALTGTVQGTVRDDNGQLLPGSMVRILDFERKVIAEVVTGVNSRYELSGIPINTSLILEASFVDYTTREKGIVLGVEGLTEDFVDGYGLSNKPEVVSVTPQTLDDLRSPIVVRFSEPMDKAVTAASLALTSDVAKTMSVGKAVPEGTLFPDGDDAIYTSTHFDVTWSDGDTLMTLVAKEGSPLPTNSTSGVGMTYRLSFHYQGGGQTGLQDADGTKGRSPVASPQNGPFRTGNGLFKPYAVLKVPGDTTNPKLESVAYFPLESGEQSDRIRVVFSEPMRLLAKLGEILGGVDGTIASAPAGGGGVSAVNAAGNYEISAPAVNAGAWTSLNALAGVPAGATASFDPLDSSNRTILIYPNDPSVDLFSGQEVVAIRLAGSVRDPAGNGATNGGAGVSAQVQ